MNVLDQKSKIISSFKIFTGLQEADVADIASHTDIVHLDTGYAVFTDGMKTGCMYIIASGEISVLKPDGYQSSREIAKLITGDSLGEIGMISGEAQNVTAICATPVDLLRFPAPDMTFRHFLDVFPRAGSHILYAFISDIADRTRRANELLKENSPHIQELRRQIYQDKLTGLFNKTYLEENLPALLKEESREISLLMMKPDNFKQVNDTAGHEAGDNLLMHIARLLPAILPRGVPPIRYFGNEFALILSGSGKKEARKTAEKIREFYNTLDVSRFMIDTDFRLTVSIGIAVYPEHAANAASLIEQAHRLPMEGRSRGGNLILFPEDSVKEVLC